MAKYTFLESVLENAETQLDLLRLRSGKSPETETVKSLFENNVENHDITRFERFRRWARENLLGLAAFAITTAGLITTLAIGLRSGVNTVARTTWTLSKAVAHVASKLGPIIGGALGIVAAILNWGSKGIFFLANNLWILGAAFLAWLLAQRRRRKIKS